MIGLIQYLNKMENFRFVTKFVGVNQECSFVVKNNNIYTSINEQFYKYNILTNSKEKLLDKNIYWFVLLNNNILIYQYENGSSLFLLKDNNETYEIYGKYYLYSSLIINNNEILIDKKNIETKRYEIVTVVNDYIRKTNLIYFPDKIINENLYVYIALNTLHIYSFEGSIVWQHGFDKLLKSKDVTQTGEIISYKNKLFIYLYDNEDKRATIALDVETGNELFRTSDFMGYIRLQEDRIYALYGKSVSILNPETYQIRKIDLSEELAVLDERCEEYVDLGESLDYTIRRFNFSPTIYEVHYPYLYFAQERGAQVGIVNLETEKLEWHAFMDIDYPVNPVVMDIKACENRLYVHCADKTLHVFEKE
jgi:hypothetical protein